MADFYSFNISIAEVGDNDVLRTATIGVTVVANNSGFVHQVMAKVVNRIEAEPEIILADYQTELY